MEPYVLIGSGFSDHNEVRRYNVNGELVGSINIDQSSCRAAARTIYIDRPGDVYAMCVSDVGLTITRYVMLDQQGQPLPRYDQLVETAPWSPGALQAAPG